MMATKSTCRHANVTDTAVVGPHEFNGGHAPSRETHRPIGYGYVIVYFGVCDDCRHEVYNVVIQRYDTSDVLPRAQARIGWTTGRPDACMRGLYPTGLTLAGSSS